MQIEMKSASIISAGLHAGVLVFALLTFSGAALDAPSSEPMPVDLVSVEDFSKMTKGVKDAPKIEMPKPMAEKTADVPKPVEQSKPKVTEKKEVEAVKAEAAPPPPQESKPDPIADKLKKLDQPKPEAKAEKLDKMPPPKPQQKPQPKFDPDKIAALLDKRDPLREASAGPIPNAAPSLGASGGSDAKLSQSEVDALRSRLRECWNPPVGASDVAKLHVVFRVLFKRDGSIAYDPTLVEASASQFGPSLAESAKRALLQCQPYKMLKVEHYDMWKDMEITFDPRDMFGG
jgi:colicin import membrane protein